MAKFIHVILRIPEQDYRLSEYATTVLTMLTGNARFPNPTVSLAVFAQHIADLKKAEADAAARLPGAVAAREAAREKVREDLGHQCDYVQAVVETQAGVVDIKAIQAIVESAAMDLKRVTPRLKSVLGLKPGAGLGSLVCTAPRSPARDTHEWEYSIDQKTYVGLPSSRQAVMTATGLPVGVPLYVRHRLLTKSGYTEWSDPLMIVLK